MSIIHLATVAVPVATVDFYHSRTVPGTRVPGTVPRGANRYLVPEIYLLLHSISKKSTVFFLTGSIVCLLVQNFTNRQSLDENF